jgi:glycogen synthase
VPSTGRSATSTHGCSSQVPDVRVLHVSWEYPPLVYGGLGHHVHALAEAQAAAGHDVAVVTQLADGAPTDEVVNGVHVVRVAVAPIRIGAGELLGWVAGLNRALARTGLALGGSWRPEVVHAHDWVVAGAARTLRDALDAPLVVTVHATEAGRHQGWLPGDLSRAIHRTEWRLVGDARRVVTSSDAMRREVMALFDAAPARVEVVRPGLDVAAWRARPRDVSAVRESHRGEGPLLVTAARLEYEKGVHTLLAAMPRLRRRFPGLRLVVVGRGSQRSALEQQVGDLRLSRAVDFTGWLGARALAATLAAADLVVLPSVYEPFGLVALETAAQGTPIAVSRTGGLAETVVDGVTGRTFAPLDPRDLAEVVTQVLDDPRGSAAMARAAVRRLRAEHDWASAAERTVEVYADAVAEHALGVPVPRRRLVARDGDLLVGVRGSADQRAARLPSGR